jgi:hypothetical protein
MKFLQLATFIQFVMIITATILLGIEIIIQQTTWINLAIILAITSILLPWLVAGTEHSIRPPAIRTARITSRKKHPSLRDKKQSQQY